MVSALRFHINLAHKSKSPTEFRFFNNSARIVIGQSKSEDEKKVPLLMDYLDDTPMGGDNTNSLCDHLNEIAKTITKISNSLEEIGKKITIIICVDCDADEGDIQEALLLFQNLPVRICIRLCTPKPEITQYWNAIAQDKEEYMLVLDNPLDTADQLQLANHWFTCGEPLHRFRYNNI